MSKDLTLQCERYALIYADFKNALNTFIWKKKNALKNINTSNVEW